MYDKGMHGMFGMYDFAAAGSGRDRVRPRGAWPEVPTARADCLPIYTIRISSRQHARACGCAMSHTPARLAR
jgi:hypothetical protein